MKFETRKTESCVGWRLAHSVVLKHEKVKKTRLITDEYIQFFQDQGIGKLQVFKLDNDDIEENIAASAIANHIAGQNVITDKSARGRCNILAATDGMISFPPDLNQYNFIDESITLATLHNMQSVKKGQLLATVKIIPYAIPQKFIDQLLTLTAKIDVSPFKEYRSTIISSSNNLNEKAFSAIENRIKSSSGTIVSVIRCEHSLQELSKEIRTASSETNVDLILISGLSAISDHRDVAPAALIKAGGQIQHLGMPVDPGNLLMLGYINDKTVIGLPSCAKSPALNGFDWILQRFAARLHISSDDIKHMGIGGLLKEDKNRPSPRYQVDNDLNKSKLLSIKVALLAAGKSSRAKTNKLLVQANGEPVISKTVTAIIKSKFIDEKDVFVITGHDSEKIETVMAQHAVQIHFNPSFETGMSASLKVANELVHEKTDYILIALADMPFVNSQTIDRLIETAVTHPEYDVIIPTFQRKRGNPVLWQRSYFHNVKNLSGDQGGRSIIKENEENVIEVEINDPGILIDLDTPEMIAQFGLTQKL
jgi:molybdenum cofactor cytidylyltransferase